MLRLAAAGPMCADPARPERLARCVRAQISGELGLPKKGVTSTGETYCMECMIEVDPDVKRCPSCDFVFDGEVRVFACPRCRSMLVLGTSECPQCGMRFRMKALRQDEGLSAGAEEEVVDDTAGTDDDASAGDDEPRLSEEQEARLDELVGSMEGLANDRAQILSRMEGRLSEERGRLADLARRDGETPRMELVEAAVLSLADEMEDLINLHSSMMGIADEISSLVDSFDLSGGAKERGLAAKALKSRFESMSAGGEELEAREKQLAKREEMVDRKIRGYAQKSKELEERERELAETLERVVREKAQLEELKEDRGAETGDWPERAAVIERLTALGASVSGSQDSADEPGEANLEEAVSRVETTVRAVVKARAALEDEVKSSVESLEEVRRLLKILDGLLGQLPEAAVEAFMKSEEFALYERVLDRLKI